MKTRSLQDLAALREPLKASFRLTLTLVLLVTMLAAIYGAIFSAQLLFKPVQDLMKDAGEAFDPKAYLPAVSGYYSTSKGELLSFPFNSSSTVMWLNNDAFRKAGLDPTKPPKTWPDLFDAARKLKAAGYDKCGFATAWITWVNLEQLSAWHNVPLSTKANGLDGFDTVLNFNTPLHVKHLETLVELQKDKTYDYSGRDSRSEAQQLCRDLMQHGAICLVAKN